MGESILKMMEELKEALRRAHEEMGGFYGDRQREMMRPTTRHLETEMGRVSGAVGDAMIRFDLLLYGLAHEGVLEYMDLTTFEADARPDMVEEQEIPDTTRDREIPPLETLEGFTAVELLDLARDRGIVADDGWRKEELIVALETDRK